MVGAIVYLSMQTENERDKRKEYLHKLNSIFDGTMEAIEDDENSFRITFTYKKYQFIYEDIQQHGFGDRTFFQGYLRIRTISNLVLSFTERERSGMRDTADSLNDAQSRWKQNAGNIVLPQALNRFKLFTNNFDLARKLLDDEDVERIFVKFVNVDARGHPVMPLEVIDGVVVLKFYSGGAFKPSLYDLIENYTAIEPYLEILSKLTNKINIIKQDVDLLK